MNCEKIRTLLEQNGIVHFTIYVLAYVIEKTENGVNIWQDTEPKQIQLYDSIESVLKEHTIYNESIEENDEKIRNIY